MRVQYKRKAGRREKKRRKEERERERERERVRERRERDKKRGHLWARDPVAEILQQLGEAKWQGSKERKKERKRERERKKKKKQRECVCEEREEVGSENCTCLLSFIPPSPPIPLSLHLAEHKYMPSLNQTRKVHPHHL